jgi:hypothetical protein
VNRFNRAASCVVLGLALSASVGCSDNIALVGRPTLQLDQDEIFAEIVRVVGYSADARVLYHDREYRIAQLESGDKVSMQVKQDSRGTFYTDLVRVHQSVR